MACIFCGIVRGDAPASLVHADESVLAFMNIRPTAPGECLVIPRAHVDHFTDLDDDTAARIMVVAQRIGRSLRRAFEPERVGFVVHGYGVSHAHLIVVPQHGPDDITSGQFAQLVDGRIAFSDRHLEVADRAVLDEHARRLAHGL